MANETELAYAAGIVDGEGCIFIGNRGGNATPKYTLKVEVCSTTPVVLRWLRNRFGGNITNATTPSDKQKPQQRWSVSTAAAGKFLAAIRPYMVIKAEQADLAIQFQLRMNHHRRGRSPMLPEETEIRAGMARQLSDMKKKVTA